MRGRARHEQPLGQRRLRHLAVKQLDGSWQLLYGGMTGIRNGTCGELRVAVTNIEDEVVRQRQTQVVTVKVFDEDTFARVVGGYAVLVSGRLR